MVNKDDLQKYFDAGVAFSNLTRAKAEELVSELVQSGEFQTGDARARSTSCSNAAVKVARRSSPRFGARSPVSSTAWGSPTSRTSRHRWPP